MIAIIIKDQNGKAGASTSSFDEKLEKFIKENPKEKDKILKKLSKEFDVKPDDIFKYILIE